ncbi:hypothetical protein GCM10017608_27740 [Agromyces luteolus]|nr:hypothetical protein GCM10017608_27740 [Agromyces luteolus]
MRRFRAPIGAVWAAMTESERLERWIGRWEGEPSTGAVTFFMTAEGDDIEGEEFRIRECNPPHRFAADTRVGEQRWHVRFDLAHVDGSTVLTFSQVLGEDDPSSMGPGWEYYLDRLAAALDDADPGTVRFEQYYPAMREHYARRT